MLSDNKLNNQLNHYYITSITAKIRPATCKSDNIGFSSNESDQLELEDELDQYIEESSCVHLCLKRSHSKLQMPIVSAPTPPQLGILYAQ